MGELGGTFKPRDVPQEYVEFKNFIHNQPQFFKTLWIPQKQRFGFSSLAHPALSAKAPLSLIELRKDAVKYVIVPLDSEKEIFLIDREYSEANRNELINNLQALNWLQKIPSFGDLAVFEVK